MPHLVILYTPQLDDETDMSDLCNDLASTMLAAKDEDQKPLFPPGGIRVLAYPAKHHAVGDGGVAGRKAKLHENNPNGGSGDYAFVYLNVRMAKGRGAVAQQHAGEALITTTKRHFEKLFVQRHIGITLQIDEGQEVFDAKHSNLHPLF